MNEKNIIIGEKKLENEEIKIIFPEYDDVINSLKNYRKIDIERKESNNKKFENSINNVISILGPRGSGKSSVLHTIYNQLLNKESKYIVFKPILPEKVDDELDLLGVILMQIDEYIKNNVRENINLSQCINKEITEVEKNFRKVFSVYYRKNPEYRTVLTKLFTSKEEYYDGIKNIISTEIHLADDFKELIASLIKYFEKDGIIFMFDDADLNPKRANEVFDLLLKYLDSENIITFITADLDKLKENLSLFYYKRHDVLDNITEMEIYGEKADISINKYVYDLLKKVMPISTRYRLKEFSNEEKMKFKVRNLGDKEKSKELKILLEDLYKKIQASKEQEDENIVKSEFLSKEKSSKYFWELTSEIFDSRPRGLMNIYNFLMNFSNNLNSVEDIEENNKDYNKIKEKLNAFLNIIIETNKILEPRVDEINEYINIKVEDIGEKEEKKVSVFVNYNAINSSIKAKLSENLRYEKKEENLKFYVMILKLGYFFEVITKSYKDDVVVSKALDEIFSNGYMGNIYPRIGDMLILFMIYEEVKAITGFNYQYQILNNSAYKKILYDNLEAKGIEILNIDDDIWKDNFKIDDSTRKLDNIISKYEGIEYDTSILQSIINRSKKENEDKICNEIEDEAIKLFYFSYKDNFIVDEEETIKTMEVRKRDFENKIRIIKKYINDYKYLVRINVEEVDNVGNSLYEVFEDYKLKNKLLLDFINYLKNQSKKYKLTYAGSTSLKTALKRINSIKINSNFIKRSEFEKFFNETMEFLSRKLKDEEYKEYKEYNIDFEKIETNFKKNGNLNYVNFDILSNEFYVDENLVAYISVMEDYPSSTETKILRYAKALIKAFYLEYKLISQIEDITKNLFLKLYFKSELYYKYIINFENKICKEKVMKKIFTNTDDFVMNTFEDMNKFERGKELEELEEKLIKDIRKSNENNNKSLLVIKDLKTSSKIISKMDRKIDAKDFDLNDLKKIINYSSSNNLIENTEKIKNNLLSDGFIMLDEFNNFVNNISHLIDKDSKNSNDIEVNRIRERLEKVLNDKNSRYESFDMDIRVEKIIWDSYKNALTNEVKEAMIRELEN